jgi:hypothetical protein
MPDLTGLSDAELMRRLNRLHAARKRRATMPRTADRPKAAERNGHAGKNGRAPTRPTPPPPPPSQTGSDGADGGRDAASGCFTAGNKFSRGNPFTQRLSAMRRAFAEAVTPEDVTEIARKLVVCAKGGDTTAAKLVLAYVVGKPADAPDPDAVDAGISEWQLLANHPSRWAVARALVDDLPAAQAIAFLRNKLATLAADDQAALDRLIADLGGGEDVDDMDEGTASTLLVAVKQIMAEHERKRR